MANVIFIPTKVDMPSDEHKSLLLAIELDKEQELVLCRGCYSSGVFYTENRWIEYDLEHGFANVIGWADLDECYKEARELQGM